jgi:hypothetical protein
MKNFIFLAIVSILITVAGFESKAQIADMKSSYTLSSDTVTNGGTSYLGNVAPVKGSDKVTIQVNCTELSGTTAGTITIQGSLDGTNFKAIPTEETQTGVATATALDVASQTFVWRFSGSPFPYYRVSWTGAGTMSATMTAKIKH